MKKFITSAAAAASSPGFSSNSRTSQDSSSDAAAPVAQLGSRSKKTPRTSVTPIKESKGQLGHAEMAEGEKGQVVTQVQEKRMSSSFQAVPIAVPSTSSASEEDPVIIITHEQPEAETPKDGKGHVDKKRRLSSFQAAWKMSFDWLSESKVGQGYAFCKVCHCNISIGHGGRHDLHRHMETEKHKINAKQASGRKVTDMFATQA
ncbi:uncharacterized protein LOC122792728 [Protopterus annectens]|uniref:uncharacterized protein LOC122792728 n=1 Tax=Protopterus annectens TaxID=7888 RepID=UPI001CFC0737|nr:uncharacterized protein LOC122792728 [Protopterus annectens]